MASATIARNSSQQLTCTWKARCTFDRSPVILQTCRLGCADARRIDAQRASGRKAIHRRVAGSQRVPLLHRGVGLATRVRFSHFEWRAQFVALQQNKQNESAKCSAPLDSQLQCHHALQTGGANSPAHGRRAAHSVRRQSFCSVRVQSARQTADISQVMHDNMISECRKAVDMQRLR